MGASVEFTARTKWIAKKHERLVTILIYRMRFRLPMVKRWGTVDDLRQEATLILHQIIQKGKYDPSKSKMSTYLGRALWNNLVGQIARSSMVKVGRGDLILTGRTKTVSDWAEIPQHLLSISPPPLLSTQKDDANERNRIFKIAMGSVSSRIVLRTVKSRLGGSKRTNDSNWKTACGEMRKALELVGVDHYE